MTKINKCLILVCIAINMVLLTSCWNYNEIESVSHLVGFTIDKDDITGEYILSNEVVFTTEDKQSFKSIVVESRGRTVQEALRNIINATGSRASLTHTTAVIIGNDLAKEGIIPILDLIDRDVETRSDMFIFVTREGKASDFFKNTKDLDEIISFKLLDYGASQNSSGAYILTRVYDFIDRYTAKGVSPTVCSITAYQTDYENVALVDGVHIFKEDKVVGYINGYDTKIYSFLMADKDFKAIYPIVLENGVRVGLELVSMDRKIKPKISKNNIIMDITLDINVIISEVQANDKNYFEKKERYKIKKTAEKHLEKSIVEFVSKIQNTYNSDIFGFGKMIEKDNPKYWSKVEDSWDELFPKVKVNPTCRFHIRGSALTNDTIRVGE